MVMPVEPTAAKIPRLTLPSSSISPQIAAHLSLSLLSHLLFLTNQIPLPLPHLTRLPPTQHNPRAAKKRADLLAALDLLDSHLHTSFTALSTAFAFRSGANERTRSAPTRAFLVFILGPSPGTSRVKVVLGLDGLTVRAWGERDDIYFDQQAEDRAEEGEEDSSSEKDDSSEESDETDDDDDESSSVSQSSESDDAPIPPPSPSPSPPGSPHPTHIFHFPPPPPPPPTRPPQTRTPTRRFSRAEEDAALAHAARLLAKTLAEHGANEDDSGAWNSASDISPTQTQVLLHAPRRFSHPAWTPRNNLARAMDELLAEFLEAAGETEVKVESTMKKRKGGKGKVEGVWVSCEAGEQTGERMQLNENAEGETAEEDEMIWWNWDGKICGFTEW